MWEPDHAKTSSTAAASVSSMLYLLAVTRDFMFSYLIMRHTFPPPPKKVTPSLPSLGRMLLCSGDGECPEWCGVRCAHLAAGGTLSSSSEASGFCLVNFIPLLSHDLTRWPEASCYLSVPHVQYGEIHADLSCRVKPLQRCKLREISFQASYFIFI